jgi:hypothetical protein
LHGYNRSPGASSANVGIKSQSSKRDDRPRLKANINEEARSISGHRRISQEFSCAQSESSTTDSGKGNGKLFLAEEIPVSPLWAPRILEHKGVSFISTYRGGNWKLIYDPGTFALLPMVTFSSRKNQKAHDKKI